MNAGESKPAASIVAAKVDNPDKSPVPSWVKHGVLYHIYPLSFADSNGDGYGDLPGIIARLDYIVSLGVTAIWLSPVYQGPMVDFGYDITDHCRIDPRFGTMRDMDKLIREAHRRGIKLLMDFVPNHTSVKHAWFEDSRRSRHSAKRDWYTWADAKPDGGPPNNWLSRFGGSGWEWDRRSGQYYLHSFLPEQADLNWRNPEVRQAMLGILRFWLDRGVDGFRTDAARSMAKDPLLRDDLPNPGFESGREDPANILLTTYSQGYQAMGDTMESICDVVAEHDNSFIVSEAYLNIPALGEMYDSCRKHPIHTPLNFNLMTMNWSAVCFREFIETYQDSLGPLDWPNYVLGNHDRHRTATRVGAARARLLAMLQLSLKGLPVIYNGEELGLEDSVITPDQEQDPWGERVPGYGFGRDPERGPMPWTAGSRGGFSTAKPWQPLAKDYRQVNVATEMKQPGSSLKLYQALIKLRSGSPALQEGDYASLETGNHKVYGFTRSVPGETFIIMLNFSHHSQIFTLPKGKFNIVVSTTTVNPQPKVSSSRKKLAPYEGRIYCWEGK